VSLPGRLTGCTILRSALILRILRLLLLSTALGADAADTFMFSDPLSRHAVGVHVVQLYDRSRLYKTSVDAITGEATTGARAAALMYQADGYRESSINFTYDFNSYNAAIGVRTR
jgi:hypothetical protein